MPCGCFLSSLCHGWKWLSSAIGCNGIIEKPCRDNKVIFVDVWDHSYDKQQLCVRVGVYMSQVAVSVLRGFTDRRIGGFTRTRSSE